MKSTKIRTFPKNCSLILIFSTFLFTLPQNIRSKIVIDHSTWEKDSDFILLDNGETIKLKHDPCKASSYIGDIPLTDNEFDLFFERTLTPQNVTMDKSPFHMQDGSPNTRTHFNHTSSLSSFNQTSNVNVTKNSDARLRQNNSRSSLIRNPLTEKVIYSESNDVLPSVSSEYIGDDPNIEELQNDDVLRNYEEPTLSRSRRAATSLKERLWPNGIIPYVIEGNFTGEQRAMFKQAMRHWENHTCITFVKRTSEPDYIVFTHRSCGCCSYVGRKGDGSQAVSVGKNCDKFGVVVHELGHVVGFWHEHTRPDRDLYITVKYENIMEGQQYNFEKLKKDAIDSLGEPYDYGSIMHYSANTFSKNGYLPTIETSDRLTGKPRNIGQRQGLSEGDIRQTKKLYGCKLCGRSLLESEGVFTSPRYPEAYDDHLDCEWRISVTSGEKIGLNISDFDLRADSSCEYEYLEIRDGHYHNSRLLGRYCDKRPFPDYFLKSSGDRLWIKFKARPN